MIYWLEILIVLAVSLGSYSPLVLILTLIMFLVFIVLWISFVINCYFYSYFLFLLFMSGLLIMFMYLCSVILNEKLVVGSFAKFYLGVMIFSSLYSWSFTMTIFDKFEVVWFFEYYNLLKFFCYPFNFAFLFFICYLLFCLVVIYELIKVHKGPLRSIS